MALNESMMMMVSEPSVYANIQPKDYRSVLAIVLCSILFIFIIIVTITGNIIVIIAITNHRALKNQQSNLFILNLAIADLAVAFTVMIWTTTAMIMDAGRDKEQSWGLGMDMCYVQCAMNYCLIVVSMMTLGFISIDRLVHIVYPLRYLEIITVKKIRIMIVWTWIQGLVIGFIPVGMKWIHYDYCETVCAVDWSSEGAVFFVIVAFITCFMLPAVTMIICYAVIFKEIRRSMQMVRTSQDCRQPSQPFGIREGSNQSSTDSSRFKVFQNSLRNMVASTSGLPSRTSREIFSEAGTPQIRRHSRTVKESTIIKSLLIVVAVFFICMTPFSVTKLIKVLKGDVPCWVNTLATIIQLAASACNPLIYGIFRKEYRRAFKAQYYKICTKMGRGSFPSIEYSDQHSFTADSRRIKRLCISRRISSINGPQTPLRTKSK